ncbi:hypothetical protein COCCADRAFT_110431 [Bipolaris zeicola 26-R-13]|uniref:Uncharacterized protein n=1 Tax=Cochliobolus carbonum (strain 26-R-13) TaxID=930089 RepID=W6XQQ1_COCC2|nr:uncharacterized protein COCCADRAFT_110431 [Bipolaris zeicola 26-R-13]EUC27938.1 hypothetical protein COCCADRAFT_110431 [Bipolaris zeicola 26-R-13]
MYMHTDTQRSEEIGRQAAWMAGAEYEGERLHIDTHQPPCIHSQTATQSNACT